MCGIAVTTYGELWNPLASEAEGAFTGRSPFKAFAEARSPDRVCMAKTGADSHSFEETSSLPRWTQD